MKKYTQNEIGIKSNIIGFLDFFYKQGKSVYLKNELKCMPKIRLCTQYNSNLKWTDFSFNFFTHNELEKIEQFFYE